MFGGMREAMRLNAPFAWLEALTAKRIASRG
jgi:hypothetical protein